MQHKSYACELVSCTLVIQGELCWPLADENDDDDDIIMIIIVYDDGVKKDRDGDDNDNNCLWRWSE